MFKVELESTKMEPLVVRAPDAASVPALTVVVPFQEFAPPERMSVPFPDLVRPLDPPRTFPETLSVAVPTEPPLLIVQVAGAPRVTFDEIVSVTAEVLAELVTVIAELEPRLMLPPERVMFEEEEMKLMSLALTSPETVIVPDPSSLVDVPKLILSEVPVVVEPDTAEVPALSCVQP